MHWAHHDEAQLQQSERAHQDMDLFVSNAEVHSLVASNPCAD